METFGQRLRKLRNRSGISQNELSKHIGVSKSSVNMYERDEREPGFETLEAIADFFNVNMDYLLGRETKTPLAGNHLKIEEVLNEFEPTRFSSPSRIAISNLFYALADWDSVDYTSNLAQAQKEIAKCCTLSDLEQLTTLLDACCAAIVEDFEYAQYQEQPPASPKADA